MGFIHVYTGDGKGKTTAAVGLALRALGAGKRVYFAQFMKSILSHEIEMLLKINKNIIIDREWSGGFVVGKPTKEQIGCVKRELKRVEKAFLKDFDVIICDEILVTIIFNILSEEDILNLLEKKPKEIELILTGRGATKNIIEKADLVTNMQKIKHYLDRGIKAREGIEF